MARCLVLTFCTLLGFTGVAIAQEAAPASVAADMPCSTLLFMIDQKEPGNLPDLPTAYQMRIIVQTMKLLTDRLGGDVVRARLGITAKDQSDPLWYGQTTVATRALLLYDRQYCVKHPLNTLGDAVDDLARQVQGRNP